MPFNAFVRLLVLPSLLLTLLSGYARAAAFDDAQQLWLRGQRAQAMQTLANALNDDPGSARLRFALAVMRLEDGDKAGAEPLLKSLTEDFPDLPDPYNNLAVIYAGRGELDAALEALTRAVALQPEHVQAQENLGDVLLQLAARAYGRAAAGSKLPAPALKAVQTRELIRTLGRAAP